ncbi:MAG: hypothetical protein ACJ73E_15025 [Mycobacteriales bacterium]
MPSRTAFRLRLGTLVIGVLAASSLAALAPSAAGAAEARVVGGTTVGADGIYRYRVDLAQIPGARVSTERGIVQATGACRFADSARGRPSGHGRVRYVTEISFDPATCSRQLATAEYPRDAVPPAVRAKLASPGQTTAKATKPSSRTGPTGPTGGVSTLASWFGSLKVNVEDPVQIDVTTTKSDLGWSYNGTTLTGSHTAHWGWYSPSGWSRNAYHWNYGNNGYYAYTDTYGKYRNGTFCFTIDTWTEHLQTYFEGWYDGYWYWSYRVDKWGGCTALLHYEYIAQTP